MWSPSSNVNDSRCRTIMICNNCTATSPINAAITQILVFSKSLNLAPRWYQTVSPVRILSSAPVYLQIASAPVGFESSRIKHHPEGHGRPTGRMGRRRRGTSVGSLARWRAPAVGLGTTNRLVAGDPHITGDPSLPLTRNIRPLLSSRVDPSGGRDPADTGYRCKSPFSGTPGSSSN